MEEEASKMGFDPLRETSPLGPSLMSNNGSNFVIPPRHNNNNNNNDDGVNDDDDDENDERHESASPNEHDNDNGSSLTKTSFRLSPLVSKVSPVPSVDPAMDDVYALAKAFHEASVRACFVLFCFVSCLVLSCLPSLVVSCFRYRSLLLGSMCCR
jgi:hypothetical protein